jgi:hypothetical protein
MPRGRKKKAPIDLRDDELDAALSSMRRPKLDFESLKVAQAIKVKSFVEALPEQRLPPATEDRALVPRIVAWYATPYEWREPKTEGEFAEVLGVTPIKLRVISSMYRDGIEMTQNEIRHASASHARLRFVEALDGQIDAAAAGSAPAFDRVKAEAWGEAIPGQTTNVTVNVTELHNEIVDKLLGPA